MSAARARQAGERPGVTLALAPPPPRLARPRLSRWQRLRCWRVHGEVSYRLRYRVLGAIVRRVATRQFWERAWLAGFNWSFDDRREPFCAGLLDEFGSGNQAGIAASMPIWSTRKQPLPRRPGRLARVARHLPASRAEAARLGKRVDGAFEALLVFARAVNGMPEPAPRRGRHLVAINPRAWQGDDR